MRKERDMVNRLLKWFEALAANRARTELHLLSDRMLKDIGLSRYDIESRFRR
jgi:uncharacterized protein YjiS (DUF1127 family)